MIQTCQRCRRPFESEAVVGGKIVDRRSPRDLLRMLRQLGVVDI